MYIKSLRRNELIKEHLLFKQLIKGISLCTKKLF